MEGTVHHRISLTSRERGYIQVVLNYTLQLIAEIKPS